ncbi:hypothetical protein GCM10009594_19550 [Kocuria palustris]|uniref:hypothetical protein n=1 Tax=Kocuria palustris TaxID=71999 RepID=UPI00195A412D|nr:hypothetical protein [Kocuria palustris]MBM7823895.1 hypothetical protein [Kocuria palustris]
MTSLSPQQRARRRRIAGLLALVGIVLLLVSTYAVPMGIIYWARATSEEAPVPLTDGALLTIIAGPVSLVLGGILSIAAFQITRAHREPRTEEDRELDEQWGDDAMIDFDPTEFNSGHRSARQRERDRWS